jgi:hypothetical protein
MTSGAGGDVSSSESAAVPEIRVEAGNPTDEEVAALVAVLASSGGTPESGGRRSGESVSTAWNAPSRRMRPVVRRGYRAWRRNALPH